MMDTRLSQCHMFYAVDIYNYSFTELLGFLGLIALLGLLELLGLLGLLELLGLLGLLGAYWYGRVGIGVAWY